MITVSITKKHPRPAPISFALYQLEGVPRPYMIAVVAEISRDIPPNTPANNHGRQFVA